MNETTKISVRQFTVLVMFYTIGSTILIIPAGLAADAKQDAWIAAIAGVGLGLLLVLLYNRIGNLFPDMTLVQYHERLLGKWAGKALSLLYIFFSFIGAATLLFYMGNFITTQVMPDTPIQFVNMLFALIVVMGLRLGIETLARAAEIFFPWFILLFLVMVILIVPQIHVQNIQPVFETGIKPLFKAALSLAGTASLTYIVFFMIFPSRVSKPEKAAKAFIIATLLGGIVIIVITLLTILVLGSDATSRHAFPSYVLARKISLGNFVERIESIMAGMWFFSIYFKTTLYFYACVVGLAHMLKLKDYRPLTLPMGMILVVYSLVVYPNAVYMAQWDSTVFIPYVLSFGLLIPLFLWGTALFRRKKIK
ncbi:endospore germination permease [Paenibacillus filicis]|uniref:Endospore germination permease n=1 Tax=Paenibacillus gyeongsangnamensis TaxID=3388067 RepID=A0ABT4QAW7_9BACL|nr:endospore germination permease [Paenibacillus filicis]MCZ8514016.1 endospore germination permease [Paenibacillus filicis]